MDNSESQASNNLKGNSVSRIITDMIGDVKKQAGSAFLIIIVDDYTAMILSSFLTMSEVLNQGVFSIERLGTKRQKFPKYHALYFISPTEESCNLVAKDFEEDSTPQYSRVHVFFSHRIMDIHLKKLVTQNIIKRVKTCKELNLSFLIRDKNLFDLGLPGALKIFTVKNNAESKSKIISSVMERLFTVCNVLREYPNIQYQKNSTFCSELAEKLNTYLSDFYEKRYHNEKRGVLLILDRTVDVTTPFLHDYTYEALVYDLFKTKDSELEFNDKKYKLDEKDELWMKYKNKHIAHVIEMLQNDFKLFMESDVSKVRDSENMQELDEMSKALQNMKGYKTKTAQFGLHLKLIEEINSRGRLNGLNSVIDLEQDVMTGINSKGESIANKNIFSKYSNVKLGKDINDPTHKFILSPLDNLRILCTFHSCLDIMEKDFSVFSSSLSADEKKPIYNLEWLGVSFSKVKNKNARRESSMSKNEIKQFKMKSKTVEYDFLRSAPKIEGIVESCSKFVLSKAEFPFVEEPKNIPVAKKNFAMGNNMFGNEGEDDDLPNLIVFVLGGIAHNEISAIERLAAEKRVSHHLVCGSTSILNAEEYIKQLKDLIPPTDPSGSSYEGLKNIDVTDIELGLIR